MEIAYSLIASTTLQHNLPLVTTNLKHFPMPDMILYAADEAGKITRWTR
ncbi:MAG: hypothetical protein L6461_22350 [Anaerolineae bacterium]|nr:hypothetical protein [Anaerolineae bacterium]